MGRTRNLAGVLSPQFLDRLVGHRRPAVRVEKRPREALAEVVLQRPDSRGEVVFRIPQSGLPHVDKTAQLPVLHQHVGQTAVAVDEHVATLADAERTASCVDGVQDANDLAELRRHPARLPADRRVVHRHARNLAGDEPGVADVVEDPDHMRHRPTAARPLDRTNVESWLADWSQFESLLYEAAALANFAYSINTADRESEVAHLRFGSEIDPQADEQRTRLQRRLVELGYVTPALETTVRRFRNQIELFSEANVPLFTELAKISTEWAKAIGAMTVDWDGEEMTPQRLWAVLA